MRLHATSTLEDHRSGAAPDQFPETVPLELPPQSQATLYRSLYNVLRQAISAGAWKPGQLLPSEASIGTRFGISRITVRHALQMLQTKGYIRTQRARRAIVLSRSPLVQSDAAADSLAQLIQAASDFKLEVKNWRSEPAPDVTLALGLPSGTHLRCLRGVLLRDGHRLARTLMYFPPAIGERLRRQDFDDAVVFRVLQRKLGVKISDVKMTVWADLAEAEDVAELGCRVGSAMFCARIVYRDEETAPLEVAYLRFPSALYRFSFSVDVNTE